MGRGEKGVDFEERTEHRLNDHADRLRALETGFATQTVIVQNLCEKVCSLINWIKALVVVWCTGMGGFFIWYIQSLPR